MDLEGVCTTASWRWVQGKMNEIYISLFFFFAIFSVALKKKIRAFKLCDCIEHQKCQPWGLSSQCMVF